MRMRSPSTLLTPLAFILGLLLSPLASVIPAAHADDALVPCAANQASPEPLPEAPDHAAQATVPPPPTAAPVQETTAPPTSPPRIFFSELMPDPEGDDALGEFIEIGNAEAHDVDVSGWTVANAAGRTAVLAARLGAGARYAWTYAETKIALSNSGTTLTLRDPEGRIADTVTYGGPARTGKAYARDADGTWKWTSSATPGGENAFDAVPPQPSVPEPPSSPEPTTAEVPDLPAAPAPVSAPRVALTALLPDPQGDDAAEWVEIGNDGTTDATLTGWKLDDAEGGSGPYPLDGVTVPAGGMLRIPRSASKIALNNDGDEVRLVAPDGAVAQLVAYANAPEGRIFARTADGWEWLPRESDGTAAGSTVATAPPAQAPTAPETEEPAAENERPEQASVGDIAPDDDALLEVDGVVTLAPGIVGKRTFAMEDGDGRAGTFVRAFGPSPIPPLAAGDRIRVTGRAAKGGGFSTVGKNIVRLAAGALDFQERAAGDVARDADGVALAVTGVVAHRGKTSLTLSDDRANGEIAVRLGRKDAPGPEIAVGATVTAKGVLRVRNGANELIIAGKSAIMLEKGPPAPPAVPDDRPIPAPTATAAPATSRRPLVFGYAAEKAAPAAVGGIAAAGIATIVALAVLAKRRRTAALDRLTTDR